MIMPAISPGYSQQRALDGLEVAERHDDGETRDLGGDAGFGGYRMRVPRRARVLGIRVHADLHGVVVAVVRALDLDDARAAGLGAHEMDRVHRRFGARVAEAPQRQPEPARELGRDRDEILGRLGEVRAERDPLLHRRARSRVRVADEHRAEPVVQVDVLGAVDVPDARAVAVVHPDGARRGGLPARRDTAGELTAASRVSARGLRRALDEIVFLLGDEPVEDREAVEPGRGGQRHDPTSVSAGLRPAFGPLRTGVTD